MSALALFAEIALDSPAQAGLAHRYSFTANANESVGTTHGTVVDPGIPTAVFVAGQLDLSANTGQGSASITEDAYVDLPNGLITNVAGSGMSGAFSIELWATVSAAFSQQRFVDFGISEGGENVSNGAFNSPFISITPNFFSESALAAEVHNGLGEINRVTQSESFPIGVQAHIVATYDHNDTDADANGTFKLYRDGALIGASAIPTNLNLNTFTNNNNWIGRSQWGGDPVFDGLFNELRLYNHALSDTDVASNAILGPDRLGYGAPGLVAYDGFDYLPAGADLLGNDGGSGFSGPWSTGGFNASIHTNYDVADDSLVHPGLLRQGNRIATAPLPDLGGMTRELEMPFGDPGTTRFLSFVLRPEGTLHEGLFNGFFGVYLNSSTGQDLFIGKSGGGALDQFVLERRGGDLQQASGTQIVLNEEFLLVLRADFTSGNDAFTLYLNPTPGDPEPLTGTFKNDMDVGIISGLTIYSTGAFSIDEIRIGNTYSDVVPITAALPGDYNHDNLVNAADYVLWRNGLAAPHTPLDPLDYATWKQNFGNGTEKVANLNAVPEPNALMLAGFPFVAFVLTRGKGKPTLRRLAILVFALLVACFVKSPAQAGLAHRYSFTTDATSAAGQFPP